MLRFIASLVAAFALFLSPILMAGGGAVMAHAPLSMTEAHCDGMMPMPHDGKAGMMKIDCAAACSALFASPPAFLPCAKTIAARPLPARFSSLDGIVGDHELPPPRNPTKS